MGGRTMIKYYNVSLVDGLNYSKRMLNLPYLERVPEDSANAYTGEYKFFGQPIVSLSANAVPKGQIDFAPPLSALMIVLNHFTLDKYVTKAVWIEGKPALLTDIFTQYDVFSLYFFDHPDKGLQVYTQPAPERYCFTYDTGDKTTVANSIRAKVEALKVQIDIILKDLPK